jgi:hypothetical protein
VLKNKYKSHKKGKVVAGAMLCGMFIENAIY